MSNPQNLSKEELLAAIETADTLLKNYKYSKALTYFTDTGNNSRNKYPKHMELMRAGRHHRIRAFVGGNGTGKSLWLALESYFHLSGRYPAWWEGHKFTNSINAWLCGKDAPGLRDGIQEILFGGIGDDDFGSGIIARDDMMDGGNPQRWMMPGNANCIGQFKVKHYTNGIFDGWSKCEFMRYEQGWAAFQGPTRQWIGFDEEPKTGDAGKIFGECLARLRGKDGNPPGLFLATFTPTNGGDAVYYTFVPQGRFPKDGTHTDDVEKFTQRVGWADVPHLDEGWKKSAVATWKLTDPNDIQARTEGFAAMGSGRILPIDEDFVIVKPFEIPEYWPRVYGMDFGYHRTACVWVVQNPQTKVKYIYDEYQRGKVINALHAEAIKAKGQWIPGLCDPSGGGRMEDGRMYIDHYRAMGLKLSPGVNTFAPGIGSLLTQFETGALKIFSTCVTLRDQIRTYRYDMNDPNKAARNQEDDLIDALRYADSRFSIYATSESDYDDFVNGTSQPSFTSYNRDDLTGY